MAIFLGQAVLGQLVASATPTLSGASLDPGRRLPYSLDLASFAIGLS
jgi:hypothetical protein